MRYEFEKKSKSKIVRGLEYNVCDVLLKDGEQYFEPDLVTEHSKSMLRAVQRIYWDTFRKYYLNGFTMLVKLSGLHFDINDVHEFVVAEDKRTPMILHYQSWPIDASGSYEEDSFALIVCNRLLFKQLFNRYWFALGCEIHFEGIVLEPSELVHMAKWIRKKRNRHTYSDLINKALLIFDNLHNGFHFRIIAREKYSKLQRIGIMKEKNNNP